MRNDIYGHCSIIFWGHLFRRMICFCGHCSIYKWVSYEFMYKWIQQKNIKSSPWVSENGCGKYGKGQWSWWIGGYAGFIRSFWLRANQGPDGSGTLHFTIIRLYPYSTHIGREITNVLRGSIDNFSSSRFPPTYVGFGISYILGNLIKAKINVP